ncbi:hypothetical protein K439DRAFT_1617653 [Ramaria rubella]|nr:hypothetical protein K439DRAFT_1617653 [Ramaria rubella]
MPIDDGMWENLQQAKILGQKGFPFYKSMSLLMPNKLTAKHTYHASNGLVGATLLHGSKDAGKTPDMTIPNAGEGRSEMIFESGGRIGLDPGNSTMSMDSNWEWDVADGLFNMDLSREFGLIPGPSVQGVYKTQNFGLGWAPEYVSHKQFSDVEQETLWCRQIQGPSSGMSSQVLSSAAPPGSGSPPKLTDQDTFGRAPPVTPQKKAMLGISKAEHAAATLEFIQLNKMWINMDQLSILCDYPAVRMYLSLISPELRKTWLLKQLWDLGGGMLPSEAI